LGLGDDGSRELHDIQRAELIGSDADNTFDVSNWREAATLNGGGGHDTVVSNKGATWKTSGNFTLSDTLLTWAQSGTFALVSIEEARLTGTARQNLFTVSGWTGTAVLDGGFSDPSAPDTVISRNDADFTLNDGELIRTAGGKTTRFTLWNISAAQLT